MDFFDVIARRYSHKAAFKPDPVPDEHLRQIVEAGMAAPSGQNRQTPEFIIVTDEALLRAVGELTRHVPLQTAPALIVVVSNPQEIVPGLQFYIEDYAAAAENVMLAATALGYACGWIDHLFRRDELRVPVCRLLGVPDDRTLMVVMPVGLPAEPGPRRSKKPFEQRASWNRYAIQRPDVSPRE